MPSNGAEAHRLNSGARLVLAPDMLGVIVWRLQPHKGTPDYLRWEELSDMEKAFAADCAEDWWDVRTTHPEHLV